MSALHQNIDKAIHQPIRLVIVSALASAGEIEFAALRDIAEISDSLLSRQLKILEEAEYVAARKGHVGKRPRTWLSLTPAGHEGLARYIAVLHQIIPGGKH